MCYIANILCIIRRGVRYIRTLLYTYIVKSLNVQSNQNKTKSSPVLQRNEALGNAPGTDE